MQTLAMKPEPAMPGGMNMLTILRLSSLIFLLALCVRSSAQELPSFEGEDELGFSIGLCYTTIPIELHPDSTLPENAALWARSGGGASLGLRYHRRLGARVKIGTQLNLVLLNNEIVYEDDEGVVIEKTLFPAAVEIPLHFSFTNRSPSNNISALFGVKLSRIIGASDEDFILGDSFMSADFGLGKEFVFPKFKVAPEIVYSFGLENLYRFSTYPEYSNYLSSLSLNQLSLKLHFY